MKDRNILVSPVKLICQHVSFCVWKNVLILKRHWKQKFSFLKRGIYFTFNKSNLSKCKVSKRKVSTSYGLKKEICFP